AVPVQLRAATATINGLLGDGGAGELVRGPGGAPFLPLTLLARRGGKATEAIFETPSGARPHVRLEVKQRNPKEGRLEFTLKVERASILRPPGACAAGAGPATLGASIAIGGTPPAPIDLSPVLTWRCGGSELATP